jgi:hypothetical protein
MDINCSIILKNCKEGKVECSYISDPSIIEQIEKVYCSPVIKNALMRYFEIVYYKQIKNQPVTISFILKLNIKPILDEIKKQNKSYTFDCESTLSAFAQVIAGKFDEFKKLLLCFNGKKDEDEKIVAFALEKTGHTVGIKFGL